MGVNQNQAGLRQQDQEGLLHNIEQGCDMLPPMSVLHKGSTRDPAIHDGPERLDGRGTPRMSSP